MSKAIEEKVPEGSIPMFTFSEEARDFLLEATYGRGLPSARNKDWIPFVLWTLRVKEFDADGALVTEFGPRYQFFAGPMANMGSELLAELDTGKRIAFRLDPGLPRSGTYHVSLNNGRLNIQPG